MSTSPTLSTSPRASQSPKSPSKLSPDEQRIVKMYGRMPTQTEMLNKRLKDRKFFDSGDYALSKAGKDTTQIGSEHPVPEIIPHHTSPPQSRHASFSLGSATAAHDPSGLAAAELGLKHRSSVA